MDNSAQPAASLPKEDGAIVARAPRSALMLTFRAVKPGADPHLCSLTQRWDLCSSQPRLKTYHVLAATEQQQHSSA